MAAAPDNEPGNGGSSAATRPTNQYGFVLPLVVVGVLALLLALLVLVGPPPSKGLFGQPSSAASYSPPPFPAPQTSAAAGVEEAAVCAEAQRLIDGADPADARTLIAKYREAGSATACEKEYVSALLRTGAPSASPSPGASQTASDATWNGTYADQIEPLAGRALAVLIAIAAAFLLARLLVLTPGLPWRPIYARSAAAWSVLGCGCAALAALGAGNALLAAQLSESAPSASALVVSLLLWLLGAFSIAVHLGGRLRVVLTVTTADAQSSPGEALQVVSYINALGSTQPDRWGIAVATTPVTVPSISVPDGTPATLLSSIVSVFTAVFSTAPWNVQIAVRANGYLAIFVTRNGAHYRSTVFRVSPAQIPATPTNGDDAAVRTARLGYKMAAAFILLTIAPRYISFANLYRDKAWRSVGLYYIANSEPWEKDADRLTVIRASLDEDPTNYLAQISYGNQLHENDAAATDLAEYAAAISQQLEERELAYRHRLILPRSEVELRLRLLVAHSIVGRNLRAAATSDPNRNYDAAVSKAISSAMEAYFLTDFRAFAAPRLQILQAVTSRVFGRTRTRMARRMVIGRYLRLRKNRWFDPDSERVLHSLAIARTSPSPVISYSLLTASTSEAVRLTDDEAAELFDRAIADPTIKQWATKDPEMADFRTRPWYLAQYPLPDETPSESVE